MTSKDAVSTKNLNRTYIAIDLKSFYASVECRERCLDPLTTNLVVADASRTSKTICLAVTPALKALGLPGRCRLFEVEEKAREYKRQTGKELEYITAVPRMALYITYSTEIYHVYLKYFAPEDIHVYSIDEVFIDATSYLKLYKKTAKELVTDVIHQILKETGITATAGIAPNLYLCKIAMDVVAKHIPADKDGVRIAELDEMTYRKELWNHKPITDFWRIGNGTAARLGRFGMFTMGDVARVSLQNEDFLYDLFGIDAEILIDHAWGYEKVGMKEIKSYKSDAKSSGCGQVLHCAYDFCKTKIVVREMAESLALDLFKKKLVTGSITLSLGYDRISLEKTDYKGEVVLDFYGREVPKPAHGTIGLGTETYSSKIIVQRTMELFERIADKSLYFRRLCINANNVISSDLRQPSLFDELEKDEEEDNLQQTRLEIMKKFGKNALLKGMDLEEGATLKERNSEIGGHRA